MIKNKKISQNKINTILNYLTKNNLRVFLVLLLWGLAIYINVLKGPMFFDDEHFIQKNKYVHHLDIKKIYTTSVTQGANMSDNFYRPNQQLVFSIIYQIVGELSWPYHLVSLLFHVLNTFCIYLIINYLGLSKKSSLIGALLFLVHPIQTEAVSYISGLADPLGLFFMLSGLIHLLKSLKEQDIKKSLYFKVLSILFFIISLFTKENMVVLLPLSILIIIIYNIIDKNNYVKKTSTLIYIFILTIITASYILMKFTIFNFSENKGLTNFSNIYTNNLHIRLLTFISVIWDYIKLIIYPINLHYEKPYIAYTQLLTWRSIFGFTLIGTTILTLVKIKQQPYLFLSSSWFFASLAPYTGIIPLNAMYLEHWLYVPIIGFSFLIAFLFEVYLNKKKYLMYLLLLLFALYSTRVIIRNEEWADVEKFYNKELKYSKNALRIYNNLGLYYANTAEKYKNNKKIFYNYNNKAKQYYQKAISISDVYPQPHHNLGNIYLSEGKIQEAFNEYIFALSIDPNFVYSLVKLYDIYKTTGQLEKAEHILKLVNKIEEGNKIAFQDIQQILINY